MHTITDFYVKVPVDLYRRGGAKTPRFDYIRTCPPRDVADKFDLKVKPNGSGGYVIDHTSGGLSLSNRPHLRTGEDWWLIPKGTPLPPGFTLTRDLTGSSFKGHYTIRSTHDIDLELWKSELGKWAEKHALHINRTSGQVESNNV